jgi:hypothetical protein
VSLWGGLGEDPVRDHLGRLFGGTLRGVSVARDVLAQPPSETNLFIDVTKPPGWAVLDTLTADFVRAVENQPVDLPDPL